MTMLNIPLRLISETGQIVLTPYWSIRAVLMVNLIRNIHMFRSVETKIIDISFGIVELSRISFVHETFNVRLIYIRKAV